MFELTSKTPYQAFRIQGTEDTAMRTMDPQATYPQMMNCFELLAEYARYRPLLDCISRQPRLSLEIADERLTEEGHMQGGGDEDHPPDNLMEHLQPLVALSYAKADQVASDPEGYH